MALIVAFVVVVAITPLAAIVAVRTGVVDRPGELKVQKSPVPYLGGVAVLAGVIGPLALDHPSLLVPLGLAAALGLADDIGDLSPGFRIACELVVGVTVAVIMPVRGPLGAIVAIVSVLALLNAVNLLDGLDGLASGVGASAAAGFALTLGAGGSRTLALALAGGLLGFLVWNRPPARIYLGDTGSYLVGTALAMLVTAAFAPGAPLALSAGSLLFVAVPVADTAVAIVRRRRAGRPLLKGDRGHLYDQLVDRGRGPLVATAACVLGQCALVGAGLGIVELPAGVAAALALIVIASVAVVLLRLFTSPASWTT